MIRNPPLVARDRTDLTLEDCEYIVRHSLLTNCPLLLEHKPQWGIGYVERAWIDHTDGRNLCASFYIDKGYELGDECSTHINKHNLNGVSMAHNIKNKKPVELSVVVIPRRPDTYIYNAGNGEKGGIQKKENQDDYVTDIGENVVYYSSRVTDSLALEMSADVKGMPVASTTGTGVTTLPSVSSMITDAAAAAGIPNAAVLAASASGQTTTSNSNATGTGNGINNNLPTGATGAGKSVSLEGGRNALSKLLEDTAAGRVLPTDESKNKDANEKTRGALGITPEVHNLLAGMITQNTQQAERAGRAEENMRQLQYQLERDRNQERIRTLERDQTRMETDSEHAKKRRRVQEEASSSSTSVPVSTPPTTNPISTTTTPAAPSPQPKPEAMSDNPDHAMIQLIERSTAIDFGKKTALLEHFNAKEMKVREAQARESEYQKREAAARAELERERKEGNERAMKDFTSKLDQFGQLVPGNNDRAKQLREIYSRQGVGVEEIHRCSILLDTMIDKARSDGASSSSSSMPPAEYRSAMDTARSLGLSNYKTPETKSSSSSSSSGRSFAADYTHPSSGSSSEAFINHDHGHIARFSALQAEGNWHKHIKEREIPKPLQRTVLNGLFAEQNSKMNSSVSDVIFPSTNGTWVFEPNKAAKIKGTPLMPYQVDLKRATVGGGGGY